MITNIWHSEEQKFLQAIQDVKIPNATLENVDFIVLKSRLDFDLIPTGGGCYWIWTNEPVIHTLHKNENPEQFNGGEIIYNGIAQDDVKGRIKHHLLGHVDAGWSGLSMDVYFGDTQSHRKKGLSENGKVPFLKEKAILKRGNKKSGAKKGDEIQFYKPIRLIDDFLKIHLSDQEKAFINSIGTPRIHFRNGIDIFEAKHQPYEFRAYFITGLNSLYLDFIEKEWRKFGLPKLCSYKSGR